MFTGGANDRPLQQTSTSGAGIKQARRRSAVFSEEMPRFFCSCVFLRAERGRLGRSSEHSTRGMQLYGEPASRVAAYFEKLIDITLADNLSWLQCFLYTFDCFRVEAEFDMYLCSRYDGPIPIVNSSERGQECIIMYLRRAHGAIILTTDRKKGSRVYHHVSQASIRHDNSEDLSKEGSKKGN